MASHFYSLSFLLVILISSTNAQKGIVLPIQKDPKTSQHYTTIEMGSNRARVKTVIDLGAQILWFSCDDYTSNTYAPIPCGSTKCELARGIGCVGCNLPPRPGCTNDTCGASPFNPFQEVLVSEGYGEDTLSLQDKRRVSEVLFSCMGNDYIQGLAKGTTGMMGLARNDNSFHKQLAGKLKFPDIFSLCLPSSGLGKLSIGQTKSGISLKSTPLIINPVSTAPIYTEGDPSDEYFINVKSIRVNGKPLSVKDSYFSIDSKGVGGTKISTIQNYTSLHSSIYKPFTRAFVKAASDLKIKSVAAVEPFRACFSSASISNVAPTIDLVFPGNDVYWRIVGANSLVRVDSKTTCLAFVDGGSKPRTSIVIGVHQLEENFLEFDLVSSQLKFSNTLSAQNKSCSRI